MVGTNTMTDLDSFHTQGMFSFTGHTSGKWEERRKTDRKTGKERRKAEKTRGLTTIISEDYTSAPTIWCIGRNGHWGSPILNDKGGLVTLNFCTECQIAEIKLDKLVAEQEAQCHYGSFEFYYGSFEWEADMIAMMEAEGLRLEKHYAKLEVERLRLEKQLEESANGDPTINNLNDDYIPEIDDDFDY